MQLEYIYKDPRFRNFCLNLTKDPNDADDLQQDVALKILLTENYHSLPYEEQLKLSYRIARNRFYDIKRSFHSKTTNPIEYEPGVEPIVERKLIAKEELQAVAEKLKQLDEKHRLMIFRQVEGESCEQLSKRYKRPLGTILCEMNHTRKFLRGETDKPKIPRNFIKDHIGEKWHNYEVVFLRKNRHLKDEKIAESLNRSVESIKNKKRKLKVKRAAAWSNEETQILFDNYPAKKAKELQKLLPGFSNERILKKLYQLKAKGLIAFVFKNDKTRPAF